MRMFRIAKSHHTENVVTVMRLLCIQSRRKGAGRNRNAVLNIQCHQRSATEMARLRYLQAAKLARNRANDLA